MLSKGNILCLVGGVDLNRNYPASWEQAKAQELSLFCLQLYAAI